MPFYILHCEEQFALSLSGLVQRCLLDFSKRALCHFEFSSITNYL